MRIVGLQSDIVWEDPEANRAAFGRRITAAAAAAGRGALIVLPEMWPTGFSMDTARVAEPPGGPSERFLVETARETGCAIGGSVAQAAGAPETGRARNVFLLAQPGGAVGRYAKIHPFTFGGEHLHYDAGDALATVETGGVRVTPLVCYDLRFAELFTARAEQTDVFVVVANWPSPRAAHFRALLIARAIEAQCFVLGVNRVGEGGGLTYEGGSLFVSPLGEVLASLPAGAEGDVVGEVDPARVARVRAELPFLRDRRPDLYRRL